MSSTFNFSTLFLVPFQLMISICIHIAWNGGDDVNRSLVRAKNAIKTSSNLHLNGNFHKKCVCVDVCSRASDDKRPLIFSRAHTKVSSSMKQWHTLPFSEQCSAVELFSLVFVQGWSEAARRCSLSLEKCSSNNL
jgi:hypothetical protein